MVANLLNRNKVKNMANPGKTANHQEVGFFLATERILPQLTSSAEIPTPIKDRVDSIRIAPAIPNTINTLAD